MATRGKFGNDLLEQLQSFRAYIHSSIRQTCDIPARAGQARNNSSSNGIAARHDNGDRRGCLFGGAGCRRTQC